ncbi:hypothetical protein [Streptomyces sp. NPDC058861]|uniref:hypothetical protein n=1 Tax=Streptomyces sp. NPDC058861 TaxID=3346653 RepID=UPI003696177C
MLMELRISTGSVDIVVRDSDPSIPAARPGPGRAGGMEIIKAVAEELFIEQEPVGKRVTARIALADTATAAPSTA